MEGRGKGRETTLVLVGRTGNGKSATGNSILGRTAFNSRKSPAAITATCELQKVQMKDGRKLNVIDTPGLFNPNVQLAILGQEIVKCIDLAKDGVHGVLWVLSIKHRFSAHGVLWVLSIKHRFSAEEATILKTLQMLFGEKISNYMVVIFTGGDELEENEQTLEAYLRVSAPALKEFLKHIDSGGYSKEQKQILLKKMEESAEKPKLTESCALYMPMEIEIGSPQRLGRLGIRCVRVLTCPLLERINFYLQTTKSLPTTKSLESSIDSPPTVTAQFQIFLLLRELSGLSRVF